MARKRGTSWQADVYVGTKRIRSTFKTKGEAEEFERKAVSMADTSNVGTVFPEFAKEMWEGRKSWRDAKRITDEWVMRLGPETPVHRITDDTIERVVKDLKTIGNAGQTINNKLTRLSKLLKRCHRKRLIPSVPFIELNKQYKGRIRFLSPDEERSLFSFLGPDDRAFSQFLLYTGCRVGEALDLEWRDVTPDTVTFWITKGDKARSVPLTEPARQALAHFKGRAVKPFLTVTYSTFSKHWDKAKEAAGLGKDDQVVPHVLRHTCASRLVQRGVDIRRVKEWMGHASINTTMRYAHLAPKDLDVAARVLEQG